MQNLWPQRLAGPMGAFAKDTVDSYVANLVCRWHLISLDSAQRIMARPQGWVTLYNRYHHAPAAERALRPEREP